MSGLLKSLKYSLFYILLMIVFYYLGCHYVYKLSFFMIAIIPINFIAIHYGILNPIKKENYVDKYYILISLFFFTEVLLLIFLKLNNVNIWVTIFNMVIHAIELIFLDLPVKGGKKLFGMEIVDPNQKKDNNEIKKEKDNKEDKAKKNHKKK